MRQKQILGKHTFDCLVVAIILGAAFYLLTEDTRVHFDRPKEHELSGYAHLIDGDSIIVESVEMRLIGMDAVELHQLCGSANEEYRCGVEAKNHLEHIIDGGIVRCRWAQTDIYHRALATCYKGDVVINRQMVLDGYAVSFNDFPSEEKLAKQQKRGIWRSPFQRPAKWRRQHPWQRAR